MTDLSPRTNIVAGVEAVCVKAFSGKEIDGDPGVDLAVKQEVEAVYARTDCF
jgi:hypothetical protein